MNGSGAKDQNGGFPNIRYAVGIGFVVAGVVLAVNYFVNGAIGFVKNSHFISPYVAALSAMIVVILASGFLMLGGSALIARSMNSTLCDLNKKWKEHKKQRG